MTTKTFFSEQQKHNQPWTWFLVIVLLTIPGFFLWGLFRQVAFGLPWLDSSMSNEDLVICSSLFSLMAIVIIVLLLFSRLDTVITVNGVSIRFFPFHRSFREYKWEEITNAFVGKYRSLRRNRRRNFRGRKDESYFFGGDRCLFLQLKSGRRLIIGTHKAYELERALKSCFLQKSN